MSAVAVLMPWGGDCPHRSAAQKYVHRWYTQNHPSWDVVMGYSGDGQSWCKGKAVVDALSRTEASILVVADADCISPTVDQAVQAVQQGSSWALPHYKVRRLSRAATGRVLAKSVCKYPVSENHSDYDKPPYITTPGGGMLVLRREAYVQAPIDYRFFGWGREDGSWGWALQALFGKPWQDPNSFLWHLWHPPQRRVSTSVGPLGVRELMYSYRDAQSDVAAMKAVLGPASAYVKNFLAGDRDFPES